MKRSGPKTDRPQRMLAALLDAGTRGMTISELAGAISGTEHITSAMRFHLDNLVADHLAFSIRKGPAVVYFHASVDREAAAATFAARVLELFQARAEKSNATRGGPPKFTIRRHQMGTPVRRRELPAVDPNGLRRDAVITGMDTAPRTVAPTPRGRYDVDPQHLSGLSKLPLGMYAEPASTWASAAAERAA